MSVAEATKVIQTLFVLKDFRW